MLAKKITNLNTFILFIILLFDVTTATINISGHVYYRDYSRNMRPIRNALVILYDNDGNGPCEMVRTNTDANGFYSENVNEEGWDPDPFDIGWQYPDVFIRVYSTTRETNLGLISMQKSFNEYYTYDSNESSHLKHDEVINIAIGVQNEDFNSHLNKAFSIFDHLQDSRQFYLEYGSGIVGGTPPNLLVLYPKSTTQFLGGPVPTIEFSPEDVISDCGQIPSIIWQFYGYFAMYDLFNNYLYSNQISSHNIDKITTRTRAWMYGWADFFAIATRDKIKGLEDSRFYYANGHYVEIKTTTDFDAVTNIDNVPGRVAGALYDLFDFSDDSNERWDDYVGNRSQKNILETMRDGGGKPYFGNFFEKYITRYYQNNLKKRTAAYGACAENGINYDTTMPSNPGIPIDEGEFSTTGNVTFGWSEAVDDESGIAGYFASITEEPSNRVLFAGWVDSTYTTVYGARNGQTVYANVYAYNGASTRGPWSGQSDGILIDLIHPSVPGVPIDDAEFTNVKVVHFHWEPAVDHESGIEKYYIQVGTKPDTNDLHDTDVGNLTSFAAEGGQHGQTLYARVQSEDKVRRCSSWSKSSDGITIDLTPPSPPCTPLDAGDFSSSSELVFRWAAAVDTISGISDYHLQVGTTPGDSTVSNQWIGPVCADTIDGEPGNTYYARVRAKNGAGSIGEWSGSSDGITIGILISLPSLQAFPLDTINVPLYAQFPSHHYDAAEINFTNYQSGLQFIGIDTSASLVGAAKWSYIYNETDARLQTAFAGSQDITGTGVFCRLTFLVVGDICTLVPITIESALFNTGQDSAATTDGSVYINPIPFYGDVDENGLVQAHDAAFVLKYLVGDIDTLDCQQFANADVTLDSTVSALDATVILQYVVGLIDSLPYVPTGDQLLATASIAMHDQAMQAGQTIELPLYLTNVDNILSFAGTVVYDPAVLRLTGIIWPGQLVDYVTYENSSNGEIRFAGAGSKAMIKDGLFATVRFTVNDGCDQPETVVTLKNLRWNENAVQKDATQATLSLVAATSEHEKQLPTEFVLGQNYPNPFNPSTTIEYGLPQAALVTLSIYDVNGRRIITLVDERQERGWHRAHWHAVNSSGQRVSSGVYLVKLKAGQFVDTKKIMLMK
ncbi:T9SS type A sorting domain-containing protein [candidate division KSB1 bacterium]|nr:T9SS type A sorting domain-containing protein [candidate division KSB1 bacterium]RQW06040.1 MAG: T9SS C-terminal target domain-containing protein [candidate division KSB1 bacterium]